MPIRIPVITQEPILTRPDRPNEDYEQKRITLTSPWVANTVQYAGPPTGHYWIVDCIIVEYASSIVESTRDIYYYVKDKYDRTARVRLARVVKSSLCWISLAAGVAHNGYGVDTSSMHGSDPLHLSVQQYDVEQGFMVTTFEAGDVFNVHFFVKEYKVV